MTSQSSSETFVAAVDWGTTSLRVWLLDDTGEVLSETRSDQGMAKLSRGEFGAVLERELAALKAPDDLPAMICGMAGARQGWQEVPYLDVPVAADAILQAATPIEVGRPVWIVPGLCQRAPAADVMRGEETQIAGAVARFDGGDSLLCLPGTHSKWVRVKDAAVTGFRTFLTGEMFSLLCDHSILRHSVGSSRRTDGQNPVFRERLRAVLENPAALPSSLFAIRAEGLLGDFPPDDAAAALSGLLIGAEIAGTREQFAGAGTEVILIASGALADLYAVALEEAGMSATVIDAEIAVRAALFEAARFKLRGN
ncbi:2-dehydro-3-deoxygalactonokinase [Aquibium oceanicum]|uniref:2-dehydro-3-deoxygalactonokinase n=1 Tax=Aquibium oceanicum TaxID=1670800 RepID=A0A1L3SL80_9HYPH|nr:2-dehydro-3-deoxygalactonokinase [Aquibium oceanicum]APH70121.1 hypothetical protein BSQ44_01030 [Aquibium oceanicum]